MTILALITGYLVLSCLVAPLIGACIHFGVHDGQNPERNRGHA